MDDNCFYDVAARHPRITALIEPFGWELYSYVVLPSPTRLRYGKSAADFWAKQALKSMNDPASAEFWTKHANTAAS